MYVHVYGYRRRRHRPLHVRAYRDPFSFSRGARALAVAFFPAVCALLLLSLLQSAVADVIRELGRFVLTEQKRR